MKLTICNKYSEKIVKRELTSLSYLVNSTKMLVKQGRIKQFKIIGEKK